jgi:hypothetical protein
VDLQAKDSLAELMGDGSTNAFDPSADDPFGDNEGGGEGSEEVHPLREGELDGRRAVDDFDAAFNAPLDTISADPLLFTVIGDESGDEGYESVDEDDGKNGGGGDGDGGGGGAPSSTHGTCMRSMSGKTIRLTEEALLRKTKGLGATKLQATWRARDDRNKVMKRLAKVNGCLALPGFVQGRSGLYERWNAYSSPPCAVVVRFEVSDEGVWTMVGQPVPRRDWLNAGGKALATTLAQELSASIERGASAAAFDEAMATAEIEAAASATVQKRQGQEQPVGKGTDTAAPAATAPAPARHISTSDDAEAYTDDAELVDKLKAAASARSVKGLEEKLAMSSGWDGDDGEMPTPGKLPEGLRGQQTAVDEDEEEMPTPGKLPHSLHGQQQAAAEERPKGAKGRDRTQGRQSPLRVEQRGLSDTQHHLHLSNSEADLLHTIEHSHANTTDLTDTQDEAWEQAKVSSVHVLAGRSGSGGGEGREQRREAGEDAEMPAFGQLPESLKRQQQAAEEAEEQPTPEPTPIRTPLRKQISSPSNSSTCSTCLTAEGNGSKTKGGSRSAKRKSKLGLGSINSTVLSGSEVNLLASIEHDPQYASMMSPLHR